MSTIDMKIGAVIVRAKHMLDRWNVHTNFHCKFKLVTAKGYGLFGVIQKMSFRRNETQCIDYVQVSINLTVLLTVLTMFNYYYYNYY